MPETVRCPFCVLGDDFRPMVAHIDGRYRCSQCGHTTRPGDAWYRCQCSKCIELMVRFASRAS